MLTTKELKGMTMQNIELGNAIVNSKQKHTIFGILFPALFGSEKTALS